MEKLIDILSEINFFSLTMDGSTDDSVTEQETIFYLLEPVFREKLPQDLHVLPLVNPITTSSEDLFAFVNEKLNENYLTNHMSK